MFSNIFYDSMLLSFKQKNKYDSISSYGYAFGYLGGGISFVLSILFLLYFKESDFDLIFNKKIVFKDTSCDYAFLTKSTVETKETIKWDDGKEYPLCKIEISNKSHPFFTGKQNLVDTAGRIEKFNQKYGKK